MSVKRLPAKTDNRLTHHSKQRRRPTQNSLSSHQGKTPGRTRPHVTRQEAAAALLERRGARRNLAPFVRQAFKVVERKPYVHNWHIDIICEHLEAATRREITNLIINVPPRFLKSIITSIAWPAWLLGNNPSEQIVCSSYSGNLSLKHSAACRRVIQSLWYKAMFPKVQLADDMNLKSEFETTEAGHRVATSVGGTVTGKGGDVLIVDDPVNPEQAMSDPERKSANDWFDQTYSTRLNDEKNGVMVVIMQRLHTDDLTGHLLKKGGWEHLCIPMEAEKSIIHDLGGDIIKRSKGDLIHPERFGPEEVKKKKVALGSYGYAGQYQQTPAPTGGGMIEIGWFKRYRTQPAEFKRIVQSWDTADKKKVTNAPSVCITWGETEKGYYILDVFRKRMEYPELKRTAKSLALKYNPSAILIEDKSSGQSLIPDLREDKEKFPVLAIQPHKDKVTRASTCSPTIEAGNVWLPEQAPWLVDFEMEVGSFPVSATKDQVDAFTQFLNWVKRKVAEPRIRRLG